MLYTKRKKTREKSLVWKYKSLDIEYWAKESLALEFTPIEMFIYNTIDQL